MSHPTENFSGQQVYVFVRNDKYRRSIEDSLRRLGAVIHMTFVENVNLIISDTKPYHGVTSTHQSAGNIELFTFNSCSYEMVGRVKKHTTKLIVNPLKVAARKGIRVLLLDEAQQQINRLLCTSHARVIHLKSPFIKVDVLNGNYEPIFREFSGAWPTLKINISNSSNIVSSNIAAKNRITMLSVFQNIEKEMKSPTEIPHEVKSTNEIPHEVKSTKMEKLKENISNNNKSIKEITTPLCFRHLSVAENLSYRILQCKFPVHQTLFQSECFEGLNYFFQNLTQFLPVLTSSSCQRKLFCGSPKHEISRQMGETVEEVSDERVPHTQVKNCEQKNIIFDILPSHCTINLFLQDIAHQLFLWDHHVDFQAQFMQTVQNMLAGKILQEMMMFNRLGKVPLKYVGDMHQITLKHEAQDTVVRELSIVKVVAKQRKGVFTKPETGTLQKPIVELGKLTTEMFLTPGPSHCANFNTGKPTMKRVRDLCMSPTEHSEDPLLKRRKFNSQSQNAVLTKKFEISNNGNIYLKKLTQFTKNKMHSNLRNNRNCTMKFHDLQSSRILNTRMLSENAFSPVPDTPGYCEICHCKCISLAKHVEELTHSTSSLLKTEHFIVLDHYISTVKRSSIFKNFEFSSI